MKLRLVIALAISSALALSLSGAEAGVPTLDGKKVKVLTLTATPGLQEHDQDTAVSVDTKVECLPPRCARLTFAYKPAKGVKGGLMFTMTWGNPGSDFDLYVGEVGKRGTTTVIGRCGGFGGPSEKVYLAPSSLRSGKTYVMVMDFARSLNDTVKGKVEINVPTTIGTKVPDKVDSLQAINCTL